jgi:O-antigen/teichoic acid export membrane protein
MLNLLGQVVPLGIAAVAVPFIVHDLGLERYGLLSLSWILLGYVSFLDFGLGRATTNAVAYYASSSRQGETAGVIWVSLRLNGALGVLGAVIAFQLTPILVDKVFGVPAALREEAVRMFTMLALSVPLVTMAMTLRGALEGVHRFDLANVVKAPSLALMFVIPMFGKPFSLDLGEIVGLIVVSRLLTVLVYGYFVWRQIPGLFDFRKPHSSTVKSLVRFAGWITVSNVFSPVLNYAERLLIPALLPLGVLAFYTAPYEIISRLPMIPASVAATLYPAFSSDQYEDLPTLASDLLVKPTKYLLMMVTPVASLFIFFAPEILQFWLGEEFRRESMVLLPILSLGFFFNCLAHIPLAAVQGLGRPDLRAKLDIGEAVVFLALTVFLIQTLGINGAALAKSIVLFLDVVIMFFLARRILKVQWAMLLPRELSDFLILSIVFLLSGMALSLSDTGLAVRGAVFLAGLVSLLSFFWFRTLSGDGTVLRSLLARMISK